MIKVVSKVTLEDTPAGFVIRHCVFICDRAMGRECDPVWQSAHIFDPSTLERVAKKFEKL